MRFPGRRQSGEQVAGCREGTPPVGRPEDVLLKSAVSGLSSGLSDLSQVSPCQDFLDLEDGFLDRLDLLLSSSSDSVTQPDRGRGKWGGIRALVPAGRLERQP